jgi:2-hydroxychromene-2-carboxylate isomerase
MRIDFFFDFYSPFSYLASIRIGEVAKKHGATIVYHPVDNVVIKRNVGTSGAPNHSLPPKYRYLRIDLERWARLYNVPLTSPDHVSPASHAVVARIDRGFIIAQRNGNEQAYLRAAYDRLWGRNPDVSERTLAELAPIAGLEPDAFIAAVDSGEIRAAADREHQEAFKRGVFGVPTFIVGDQLFWGNDRIEMLDEYLGRHSGSGARAR